MVKVQGVETVERGWGVGYISWEARSMMQPLCLPIRGGKGTLVSPTIYLRYG